MLVPIAVGEVWHRLTSMCLTNVVQAETFNILTLLQVGVAVSVDVTQ